MYNGYMGKILYVDLSHKKFTVKPLEQRVLRSFIGGTGLAAHIISSYDLSGCSALSPQSPLVFSTGPLTGTVAPSSGRLAVCAKSPLTGIWGEADCGGSWGPRLKRAGYDAVVIEGKADSPVYLYISDSGIEILDAEKIWGLDTYSTSDKLEELHSNKASSVCIGPAGEKQIPIANIMTEGYHARAAGRCGLGAVMGSKNLKAVVVKGSLKANIADPDGLKASVKSIVPNIIQKTQGLKTMGTAGGVVGSAVLGDMSAKNWTDGNWVAGAERVSGEEMARRLVVGNYNCPTCVIGCGKTVRIPKGRFKDNLSGAPEYETIAGFGAQLLIDDLDVIVEANDLCNRYGVDTISLSGCVAFIFEAVEKGLLEVPEGYPELKWGNGEALIFLINEMINNQGLGVFIGNGVRWSSKKLGAETEEFAMHVKGLELPYHDPRAMSSLAVAYATQHRGACHRGCTHNLERFSVPELGYPEILDRHASEGKGIASARMQNYAELYNCLKLCQFIMGAVQISDILKWLNCVTGWDMDLEEFLQVGERSINLKRLLNLGFGLQPNEDKIPIRLITQPFSSGNSAGFVPDFQTMLNEYYIERGWDCNGVPKREVVERLGLEVIK